MANPNAGRFCWHELMSTDIKAALEFYKSMFDWNVKEMPMGEMGTYYLLQIGDKQIAGGMKSPPGAPSFWLTYVAVESCDASAKKITELGGKIKMPPTTVPDMLRFAVAEDPQGAAFGVLEPLGAGATAPIPDGPHPPGTFTWDELHTKDQTAAGKFYGTLFGWTGKVADGDPMKYWHWMNAGKDIGGMMDLQQPNVPPHWLGYVAVSDVDAMTKKVKGLGGKVLMEPMDIPKTGKFSIVQDPAGAVFALFRSARV
jgi:predicted enzyme related to lactoylglutathione lyase